MCDRTAIPEGIRIHNLNGVTHSNAKYPGDIFSNPDNNWDVNDHGTLLGLIGLNNFNSIANLYATLGFDYDEKPIEVNVNEEYDNACYSHLNKKNTAVEFIFGSKSKKNYTREYIRDVDTVGHEYTHFAQDYYVNSSSSVDYSTSLGSGYSVRNSSNVNWLEAEAISEGTADIMGMLIEASLENISIHDDIFWNMGEHYDSSYNLSNFIDTSQFETSIRYHGSDCSTGNRTVSELLDFYDDLKTLYITKDIKKNDLDLSKGDSYIKTQEWIDSFISRNNLKSNQYKIYDYVEYGDGPGHKDGYIVVGILRYLVENTDLNIDKLLNLWFTTITKLSPDSEFSDLRSCLISAATQCKLTDYSYDIIDACKSVGIYREYCISGHVISFDGTNICPIDNLIATYYRQDGTKISSQFFPDCNGYIEMEISETVENGYLIIDATGYEQQRIDINFPKYSREIYTDDHYAPVYTFGTVALSLISTNTHNITGVITIADTDTDMTNNIPLEGADVTIAITGYMDAVATSDSNGEYTLSNIPTGTFTMTVSKDGYIPVTQTITINEDDTDLIYNITIEAISSEYEGVGFARGTIYDVGTGLPVSGMTLYIREGLDNTTGPIKATSYMNDNTTYSTGIGLPAGNYTIQIVDNRTGITEAERYITSSFNIKILGGMTIENQNGYVSNSLSAEALRIVLTWGESPRDLDSHLVGPTADGDKYHICFYNKEYGTEANLDVDDTSSYGPETVTISSFNEGIYTYAVHDYTNGRSSSSTALANSGAQVKVYRGTTLLATYNVPSNKEGTLWTVFTYNSNTKRFTTVNKMTYDSSSVGSLLSTTAASPATLSIDDVVDPYDYDYDEIVMIIFDGILDHKKN